jgi:hypothetical protein
MRYVDIPWADRAILFETTIPRAVGGEVVQTRELIARLIPAFVAAGYAIPDDAETAAAMARNLSRMGAAGHPWSQTIGAPFKFFGRTAFHRVWRAPAGTPQADGVTTIHPAVKEDEQEWSAPATPPPAKSNKLMAWALANPDDPRAAVIFELWGEIPNA